MDSQDLDTMSISNLEKLDWSVLTAEHIENEQLKALYNKVGRVLVISEGIACMINLPYGLPCVCVCVCVHCRVGELHTQTAGEN